MSASTVKAPRLPRSPAVVFLAPFALLFLATYLLPSVYALYKSFFVIRREGAFGAPREELGGFDNYVRAFHDADFLRGIGRVVAFGAVQYPIMILLALVLALMIDSELARSTRVFRMAYFAPYAVPAVIATLMWSFLYSPDLSPIVGWLGNLGLAVDFLGSDAVLWSIANIVTWAFCGFNLLILLTALTAADREIYQAARLDGASGWQIIRYLKLPLLRPALVLATVFSIIGILQLFTEPQVLSGLATSITTDYTPSLAAFNQVNANNYPYASALAMILALSTAVLSATFMWLVRRAR